MRVLFFLFLISLTACSSIEETQKSHIKERNERKDLIHRLSHEQRYPASKLQALEPEPYPWEEGYLGGCPPVTKESFRCKGKHSHSLPLQSGQEFIYPVLLDLLNYLQAKTGCPAVITCGHRCPEHHRLAEPAAYSANSKHLIGAEVDFYLAGMEKKPEEVIYQIMAYYKEKEPYKHDKEHAVFAQLDSSQVNVSTAPWYNKEILIKLYLPHEGRDADNQHKFPYIGLQVRFDKEKNEKVIYSKEKTQLKY